MLKVRFEDAGLKSRPSCSACWIDFRPRDTGSASCSAKAVGCIPVEVRTNSGSPSAWRKRDSAWLTEDWASPSRAPGGRDIAFVDQCQKHLEQIEIEFFRIDAAHLGSLASMGKRIFGLASNNSPGTIGNCDNG